LYPVVLLIAYQLELPSKALVGVSFICDMLRSVTAQGFLFDQINAMKIFLLPRACHKAASQKRDKNSE
jgi:hypothetical protein